MSRSSRHARTAPAVSPAPFAGRPWPSAGGLTSGGQTLDEHTQRTMSARFGHDFSRVRIHTDARAEESAGAMGANAFTLGHDIVFGPGKYQSGSRETERLLAHELTHVAQQQQSGPGDASRASRRSDASEREAEGLASEVLAGHSVRVQAAPGAAVARAESDQTCSFDDPGPDASASVCAPGLPDPPTPAPVLMTPGPVFGPQLPMYGPQLPPPNSEDVTCPLDPSSRTCGPDPDPAEVSCAMDPEPDAAQEPDAPQTTDSGGGGGLGTAANDGLGIGLGYCGLAPGLLGAACTLAGGAQTLATGPDSNDPNYEFKKDTQGAGLGLAGLSLLGVEFAGPLGLVLSMGLAAGDASDYMWDKMIEGGMRDNPGQFGPDAFDVFNEGQQGYGP